MDNILNLKIDTGLGTNLVVGWMIKIGMIFLVILAFILLRQESLMDKVVNIPLGRNFKLVILSFFVLSVVLTAIVILV